jgi:hypothetical protein
MLQRLVALAVLVASVASASACATRPPEEADVVATDSGPDTPDAADTGGSDAKESIFEDATVQGGELPETSINPNNLPPEVKVLAPVAGTAVVLNQPVTVTVQVSDDWTLLAQLAATVTLTEGKAALEDVVVQPGGILTLVVRPQQLGALTVRWTVYDSGGESTSQDHTLQVVATALSPSVAIVPLQPKTTDDLLATLTPPASDQAADLTHYEFHWSRNAGATTVWDGPLVPGAQTSVGELWTVQVVDSWQGGVAVATGSVTIGNTAPTSAVLALQPWQPSLVSSVSCELVDGALDADNQPVDLQVQWLKNGLPLPGAPTADSLQLAVLVAGQWQAQYPLAAGDVLSCRATPTDGQLAALATEVSATLLGYNACSGGTSGCATMATCTPVGVGATCACSDGYVGTGAFCTDLDECATDLDDCSDLAVCSNTPGSFVCDCPAGLSADASSCVDVDECANGTAVCDTQATCLNLYGTYGCLCGEGWSGNGKVCADVDECALGLAGCALAADCSNTTGGYTCTCQPGYSGDGEVCLDVDECAVANGGCSALAGCINLPGSVTCTACPPGTEGDGQSCQDIDECAADNGGCALAADCSNTVGDFYCVCPPGYVGDGSTCLDVDECALGDACSLFASCTNTEGDYACTCDDGYIGNGLACEDRNECDDGSNLCDDQASCLNLPGGYLCNCDSGWQGNGLLCEDVNECESGAALCDPNATCDNGMGDYTCTCKQGWQGSGAVCTDIDECGQGLLVCDESAFCDNTEGGAACVCAPGYVPDGNACVLEL